MTTERIDIIVSEKGSRVVKRDLEGIGAGARTAAAGVDFLKKALLGLGAALAVRELIRMADTYTMLNNKLRLVTSGSQNLSDVNEALFASAQRNRSSYEATVDLYARVARSAGQLGLSQNDLIGITDAVNQSLRISGASSAEAASAVLQLGQAMGSGVLRGEELNAIMEASPRLAQAIADGMGVPLGALRALGAEGKLTSAEVVAAIQKAGPAIQAEFNTMQATVGESLQTLSDAVLKWIGDMDQALGISAALANAISFLAANLDTIAMLAGVVGIALATAFALSLASNVMAIVSEVIRLEMALGATGRASAIFSAALKMAQGAVRGLTAAVAANPIGLLIVGIVTIISYLYMFRDEISVTADGVVSLGDVFRAVMSFIMELIGPVVEFFRSAWSEGISNVSGWFGDFLDTVISVLSSVLSFAATIINAYIGFWVGAYNAIIAGWGLFPGAMRDLAVMAMNGLIDIIAAGIQGVLNAIQSLLTFIGSAATLVGAENPFANMISPDAIAGSLAEFKGTVTGAASDLGGVVAGAFGDAMGTDYLGAALDGVMARARAIATERNALAAGGALDPAGGAPVSPTNPAGTGGGAAAQKAVNDELQRAEDILKDIKGPLDDYNKDLAALDTLLKSGAITAAEYNDKFREIRMTFLETSNDFASGIELGLLKVQEDFGNMTQQVSGFIGSTFNGATDLITNFVMTGKFAFADFASSVIKNLSQMVTEMLIMKPIAEALKGALSGMGTGGGGGAGGFLSSLFGGGGGMGGGGMGGGIGSLFGGFATGGSFTVGGAGGVDSQMVAFRASPGEKVDITRPGEQKNGSNETTSGNMSITMNVYTQDAQSFKRSEGQVQAQLARMAQRGKRNL